MFAVAAYGFQFVLTAGAERWEINSRLPIRTIATGCASILCLAAILSVVRLPHISPEGTASANSAVDAKYLQHIAPSVFAPLPRSGEAWVALVSRWDDVNSYRVKAAELAVDQKLCSDVQSSSLGGTGTPLNFAIACRDGEMFSYDETAIDAGAMGTPQEAPPSSVGASSDSNTENMDQIDQDRIRHCMEHPDSFGHSFMCSDVPTPPPTVVVIVPNNSDDDDGN
jgi:hypothetical protein